MGFIKRLSGGRDEQLVDEERIGAEPPAAPRPAATVQVDFSHGEFRTGRPQVPDGHVDWPVDPKSGLVFDDEWLLSGLKNAVNENQY